MSDKKLIIPRKLSGFMELKPYKQILLDEMIDKIKKVYQKNGFLPLDTPVLELSEILFAKSGNSIDKEVYHFTKGDTDICMRYDLTVPLARFVAMNSDTLSFPFKRYQIGKVYRGERAQKGRFREFIQCDADIVGVDELPVVADAECLKIVEQVFSALNLDIIIRISNRNILFGICEGLGYKEQTQEILIVLDKIDKIGKENVLEELDKIGVSKKHQQQILNVTLQRGQFEKVISNIENLVDNETYQKGINELKELYLYLSSMSVDENKFVLDLSIIRGQNYYTGTVFEAVLPSHPEFGTVCGGGRYDNLAGYFTEKKLPGVGLSIGLTRLFDLLDQNDMLPEYSLTNLDLQIIPLGDTLLDCLKLQNFLQKDLICEVNYDNRSFKSKMKEANKRQIPYIIVVGENEVKEQKFSLKNMISGEQVLLDKKDISNYIKKMK